MRWSDALAIDPVLLATIVAVVAVVARIRTRAAAPQSRWRGPALAGATALLVLSWLSPLQTIGVHYLLTAHLVQLLLVMGVVAPLLLLALPDALARPLSARTRRVLALVFHPVSGMVVVNVVFFAWHTPAAYDLALQSAWASDAMQLSILAASVMFWWPIINPLGGRRVVSRWATLGYILVATIPQTFAGITVALAKHVLYAPYQDVPNLFGMSALTDQQVAGACIALVSKVALFTAFSIVFLRMLSDEPAADTDDGGGGGGGRRRPVVDSPTPAPTGCVPWLKELNAGRTVPEPTPQIRMPVAR